MTEKPHNPLDKTVYEFSAGKAKDSKSAPKSSTSKSTSAKKES